MFGTSKTEPAAAYGGVTYESHVETFYGHNNEAAVSKRLGELGAQGWEPVAVVPRAIGLGRAGKGDDAYTVILKRRVLAP